MAINGGSISTTSTPVLSNTTAVKLCQVPPGVGTVVVTNNCGQIIYVTAGVTATATNGTAIGNGQSITFNTYPGSLGTALSVIAAAAPTAGAPVGWLISSAQ